MTFIAKPKVAHPVAAEERARPHAPRLRRRAVHAVRRLRPRLHHRGHRRGVLGLDASSRRTWSSSPGIGCSSKTTAYFVSGGHGFNSVHGRMPSIAMGANAANRKLHYIGVSGDGDTLSIGLGQFCHAIRRNLNMLYIIENNGVYGLTKGQFSASADVGTQGEEGRNQLPAADRSGAARADARRHVRRAQFLGRQGAARAADPGRPASQGLRADRRALALRDVQRSRGLDQELRLHARALRGRGARRFRAARARDHGGIRGRRIAARGHARWQPHRAAQARCGLRSHRPRRRG